MRQLAVLAAAFGIASSVSAQSSDGPELVIRGLMRAMYSNDAGAFKRLTIPNPRIDLLTTGGTVNQDALRELDEDPDGLQIIMKRPFEYRGAPAKLDAEGKYPIGTTVVYVVAHHRSPIVMVVQNETEGWRVDPRWWIAMVDLATGRAPGPAAPEYAARALLAALIAMNREEALRYSIAGADSEILFDGAPSQREPSGHLDALAMEMPTVELGPGEFRVLPAGRVVEGSSKPDVKVLVGLLGSVEIPFVVRLIGADWKVEPQPYFALINR